MTKEILIVLGKEIRPHSGGRIDDSRFNPVKSHYLASMHEDEPVLLG